jgi:hypothetical protein
VDRDLGECPDEAGGANDEKDVTYEGARQQVGEHERPGSVEGDSVGHVVEAPEEGPTGFAQPVDCGGPYQLGPRPVEAHDPIFVRAA